MTPAEEDRLVLWGGGILIGAIILKGLAAYFSKSGPPATTVGGWLQALLNPSGYFYQPGVTLIVTFPDGSSHAVDPAWVDTATGQFTWPGDNQTYVLFTNPAGKHFALSSAGLTTADALAAAAADVSNL
jgi:hypothetical protein